MNSKFITVSVIFVSVLLFGLTAYYFFQNNSNSDNRDSDGGSTNSAVEKSFTLSPTYLGNNNWEYTVKGEFPNGCYSAKTEAIVLESYPETIKVKVVIFDESRGKLCTQVLIGYEEKLKGSYSKDARFELEVSTLFR